VRFDVWPQDQAVRASVLGAAIEVFMHPTKVHDQRGRLEFIQLNHGNLGCDKKRTFVALQ
jgi:hypothetical protein